MGTSSSGTLSRRRINAYTIYIPYGTLTGFRQNLYGITMEASPYAAQGSWEAAINRLFNCTDAEVEAQLNQLYSKDCRVVSNGNKMSWDGLFEFIKYTRDATTVIEIKGQHWVRSGDMFAGKHQVTGQYKDGSHAVAETMIIGQVNRSGQAIWLEEVFRLV